MQAVYDNINMSRLLNLSTELFEQLIYQYVNMAGVEEANEGILVLLTSLLYLLQRVALPIQSLGRPSSMK